MAQKTLQDLIEDIDQVRTNPANIQQVVLNTLEQASDGQYDVVDPSNPFVFLLESAIAVGAAGIQRNERLLRSQYPSLAQTMDELYHHMADVDYINRFATPGELTFTFLLDSDEIRERAIDGGDGIRRIVIPRDTEITVEDFTFTLHYPIEIRVMPHGGMQVVYDTSVDNPLKTLQTNQLDWSMTRLPAAAQDLAHIELLRINIPIEQVKITSKREQITSSSGFTRVYNLNQKFYHARVYIERNNRWEEIYTTHSDLVYDPKKITAQLTHLDDRIEINIPQIYLSNNLLNRNIRIDIYTTHGDINHCFDRYEPRNFQARWRDLSQQESPFVEPIRSFTTMTLFADDCVTGGQDGLSFDQLRERIIHNAIGPIDIPITPSQLEKQTARQGYQIVKDVDHLTNRIYKATRLVNQPDTQVDITSPIGVTIKTFEDSADSMVLYKGVYDNNQRVTISNGTLFQQQRGLLHMVDDATIDQIQDATPTSKIQLINDANYVYIPFHYVVDMTSNVFDLRAYQLDHPFIRVKEFVDENQSIPLQVSAMRYGITHQKDGYRVVLTTQSSQAFKQVNENQIHVFMGFQPTYENEFAYKKGVFLGRTDNNEMTFEFFIACNFDVDHNDQLMTTNFQISTGTDTDYGVNLDQGMDLIFAIQDPDIPSAEESSISDFIPNFLAPANTYGIIHEKLHIHFGDALHQLWRKARTVPGPLQYERYQDDVVATYQQPVFKRDANGLLDLTYDSNTGDVTYTQLHEVGDTVLDEQGDPVYAHRAGDVKLDAFGDPIEIHPRKRHRQIDLVLFEGVFAFVDDPSIIQYAQESASRIVQWCIEDINDLSQNLLENTQMWFYPRTTMGDIQATVESGISVTLPSQQSFDVTFYLNEINHQNLALREDLVTIATRQINQALQNDVVSTTQIASDIHSQISDQVIDVTISGLGGQEQYNVLTIQEKSALLGIQKRLTVLSDNTLTVQDDISFHFIQHTHS